MKTLLVISALVAAATAQAQHLHFSSPAEVWTGNLMATFASDSTVGQQIATAYNYLGADRLAYNVVWNDGQASLGPSVGWSREVALELSAGANFAMVEIGGSAGQTHRTSFDVAVTQISAGVARVDVQYVITVKRGDGLTQMRGTIPLGTVKQNAPNQIALPEAPARPQAPLIKLGWATGGGNWHTNSISVESWGWNGEAFELNITTYNVQVFVGDADGGPDVRDVAITTPPTT